MSNRKIGRLTRNAMLAATALIIFVVEAQIPVPVPIPGVKLGLANVITVYAMFIIALSITGRAIIQAYG
ncbi:MAG: Gx transporter family protein [Clostridia bacterium]|nr:Gx transporter family protein [Clostridia bacterium]